ncbi:hypothetical protein B0H10DRAFT_2230873 [Mycena sp. CBHHK59/15]|nr:hypothetical protein B0H10DRAFT_2230873 [Mycena sp. CBHHK59/15]
MSMPICVGTAAPRSTKILAGGEREREMASIMQGLDISGVSRTRRTESARHNPLAHPVGRHPSSPPEQDVPPVHVPEVAGGYLNEFELARTCDENNAAVEDNEAHRVELIYLDPSPASPKSYATPSPSRRALRLVPLPALPPRSSPIIQPTDSATYPDGAQHLVDPLDVDAALTALLPPVAHTPIAPESPFFSAPHESKIVQGSSTPSTTDLAPAPAIDVQRQKLAGDFTAYVSVEGWAEAPPIGELVFW